MKKISRRDFLKVTAVTGGAAMLAACGGSSSSAPASSAAGTGLPGEGKTIALVCSKVGTQMFLLQMVNALNQAKKHPRHNAPSAF